MLDTMLVTTTHWNAPRVILVLVKLSQDSLSVMDVTLVDSPVSQGHLNARNVHLDGIRMRPMRLIAKHVVPGLRQLLAQQCVVLAILDSIQRPMKHGHVQHVQQVTIAQVMQTQHVIFVLWEDILVKVQQYVLYVLQGAMGIQQASVRAYYAMLVLLNNNTANHHVTLVLLVQMQRLGLLYVHL